MKYYFLLVLLYSIIYVHADSSEDNCLDTQNFSEKECFQKSVSQFDYCCVLTYKKEGQSFRVCNQITTNYNNQGLDDYIQFLEKYEHLSDISFKCESDSTSKPESDSTSKPESGSRSKSKYLQFGILSLLILIITL